MTTEPLIPNNLKPERLAAGIATPGAFAELAGLDPERYEQLEAGRVLPTRAEMDHVREALGDVEPSRLYLLSWRQLIGIEDADDNMSGMAQTWRTWRDQSHLLMSREELTWFDQRPGPDHQADVYLNLSCGTQASPHLLLDTVAVLQALDISFVAAAGPSGGCCGKPMLCKGRTEAFERHSLGRLERSLQWGARTHINWCGACQQTSTNAAARRQLTGGEEHPVREVQLLPFLEERVRALGDRAPWKHRPNRRVIAEGHPWSPVHEGSRDASARLLSMVPGVEVVGTYDGFSDDSPCTTAGREPSMPPPAWTRSPRTRAEIDAHRVRLADDLNARGADTVSCMHQSCHQIWATYASQRLAVRHAVSILAEALGCAHPDRHQEAVQTGDPERYLEESRPRWESWAMPEERARELAERICDPDSAGASINSTQHCRVSLTPAETLQIHSD